MRSKIQSTCVLFPVGPTENLGYQILAETTLRRLASQFEHVYVFQSSKYSKINDYILNKNITFFKNTELYNNTDSLGNEYFSLSKAAEQQKFGSDYIKKFPHKFAIQVHCNQYFTKRQILKLELYLQLLSILKKPWGWIGKRYLCENYRTTTIKQLPWIINLKNSSEQYFQPDSLVHKGETIESRWTLKFHNYLLRLSLPCLTDVLFEYDLIDIRERFDYYYRHMSNESNVSTFIENIFQKFSKIKFRKIMAIDDATQNILRLYSAKSISKVFIANYLR
jgi:hypothetical protein